MSVSILFLFLLSSVVGSQESCCCDIIGDLKPCIHLNKTYCESNFGVCRPPLIPTCCCDLPDDRPCVPNISIEICNKTHEAFCINITSIAPTFYCGFLLVITLLLL